MTSIVRPQPHPCPFCGLSVTRSYFEVFDPVDHPDFSGSPLVIWSDGQITPPLGTPNPFQLDEGDEGVEAEHLGQLGDYIAVCPHCQSIFPASLVPWTNQDLPPLPEEIHDSVLKSPLGANSEPSLDSELSKATFEQTIEYLEHFYKSTPTLISWATWTAAQQLVITGSWRVRRQQHVSAEMWQRARECLAKFRESVGQIHEGTLRSLASNRLIGMHDQDERDYFENDFPVEELLVLANIERIIGDPLLGQYSNLDNKLRHHWARQVFRLFKSRPYDNRWAINQAYEPEGTFTPHAELVKSQNNHYFEYSKLMQTFMSDHGLKPNVHSWPMELQVEWDEIYRNMCEIASQALSEHRKSLGSSFSKSDLTFSFQSLGSGKDEQYPGMSYQNFWGDQYEWTALLPLAWKLVSTNGRIRPDSTNHQKACCWWNVPLHLLGLGMGWTNIALGLQQWRELGYPADTPVLRFIKESYGTSIEALEVFLVTREQFNYEFIETLKLYGFSQFLPDDNLRASQYEDLDLGSDERYLEQAKRRHNFGPRWEMAKHLLLGGYDSCHLSAHFQFSAAFDETVVHDVKELDEIEALFLTENRIGIETPAYKGFCYRLIEAMGMHSEKYETSPIVSLYIKTLGHIGDFQHSRVTGRFFLIGDPVNRMYDAHYLHLLGNTA